MTTMAMARWRDGDDGSSGVYGRGSGLQGGSGVWF